MESLTRRLPMTRPGGMSSTYRMMRQDSSVQHTKLRDQETATKLKKYWGERLDALRDVLSP